jgi:hypothetical protein
MRLIHGLPGDLAGLLELDVTVVVGGQGPHFVDDVHQDLGPILRQALTRDGVVGEDPLLLGGNLEKLRDVANARQALGPADRHGLEVLGAHHGPDPRAPGGAVQVVDYARVEDAVLPRLTDG